jgi:hypothetical protein
MSSGRPFRFLGDFDQCPIAGYRLGGGDEAGVGEDHLAIAVIEQIGELGPLPVPVHRHGYGAQHPDTKAGFDERDLVVQVDGDSVTGRDIKGCKAVRDCASTGADVFVVSEDVSTSHARHQSAIRVARHVANMLAKSLR